MATEKINSEIKSNVNEGKKYTTRAISGVFETVKSINAGFFGESKLVIDSETGSIVVYRVKPGLKDLITVHRRRFIR
jgi:hypothetical protein